MDFDTYQRQAQDTDQIPTHIKGMDKVSYCVLGATDQLGELARVVKKRQRDGGEYRGQKEDLAERLGFLLWYLSTAATAVNLTLEGIAKHNINFNDKRWPYNPELGRDFDEAFPVSERLPEAMWVKFESAGGVPAKVNVKAFLGSDYRDEYSFGDVIDDNANAEDGYRFHDVFHLGYYAHLGWSPVVRALLGRNEKASTFKRKSKPDVDRVEDGARARDREEAATVFIYHYAHDHDFFDTATTVDTDILTLVRRITDDLEVQERSRSDWQTAIIESAKAQKQLIENNGGWVFASRLERRIHFSKSGPSAGGSI